MRHVYVAYRQDLYTLEAVSLLGIYKDVGTARRACDREDGDTTPGYNEWQQTRGERNAITQTSRLCKHPRLRGQYWSVKREPVQVDGEE